MSVFLPKNRFVVMAKSSALVDPPVSKEGWRVPSITVMGSFRNVSGLEAETDSTEWKTGDMITTQKIPGETKYPNVVLKKGQDNDMSIYTWRSHVYSPDCGEQGIDFRETFILVLDRSCVVQRIAIIGAAWPQKYASDDLDSMSSDALLETVELAHAGWYWLHAGNKDALVTQGRTFGIHEYLGMTIAAKGNLLVVNPLKTVGGA